MARAVALFVAVAAAAVLAVACGTAPQQVEVGELQTESRSVELEGADSVKANLRLALGELDVGGGATGSRLMEADFAYNVAAWEPSVDYGVVGDSGELEVRQQGLTEGIPTRDVRNEWDVRLGEDVPVDLTVQMGGGVGNLDLDGLDLTGLNLDVGAGSTRVDLSGDWGRDLSAVVRGGAGEVTMLLPGQMGVRVNAGTRLGRVNAEGLQKDGEAYVNDAYDGDSGHTLEVDITGGVGQINLQLVQQEGPEAGAAQQERTTAQRGGEMAMQGGETTMMREGTEAAGEAGMTMMQGGTTAMEDGATTTEGAAVGPADVVEDPQRYYGRTTTVGGAVGQVVEPRAFVVVEEQTAQDGPPSAAELAEGGVLVVRTGGPAPDVAALDDVRAAGTLQEFDVTAFEQQQGVELDDDLYEGYQGEPVLVAAEILPAQNEATSP